MFTRFIKYSFVGLLGFFINMLVFVFCERAGIYYMISATLSFLVAASHNFLWHYFWTFKNKPMEDVPSFKRYMNFIFVSSFCLSVNLILLYFFVEVWQFVKWQAQIIAVLTMSVLSFTMQNSITFADAKKDE